MSRGWRFSIFGLWMSFLFFNEGAALQIGLILMRCVNTEELLTFKLIKILVDLLCHLHEILFDTLWKYCMCKIIFFKSIKIC